MSRVMRDSIEKMVQSYHAVHLRDPGMIKITSAQLRKLRDEMVADGSIGPGDTSPLSIWGIPVIADDRMVAP